MKNYTLLAISILLVLTHCRDRDQNIYTETPTQRTQGSIISLREELINAKDGWLFSYFPMVDSLKFSDLNKNIKNSDNAIFFLNREYEEGGYHFYMKFNDKGTVEMLSDQNYETATTPVTSDFEIKQNTYTQLSFTTYNYVHQLLKSDFLFWKKDTDGRLILRTNKYLDKNKEYVVMTPIRLKDNERPTDKMYQIFYQKFRFEKAENPVLIIKNPQGDTLFKSNHIARKISKEKRYTVFVKNWQPNFYISNYYSGLGSGYMPTETGLFFYPGIRLNENIVFRTFTLATPNTYTATQAGYTAEITF